MVTFAQLRAAKPALWQQAADDWLSMANHVANCADEIRAKGTEQLPEHWQDELGQQAGDELAVLANKFESASDEMRCAVMVLDALAKTIEIAQTALNAAIQQASVRGLATAADGTLSIMPDAIVIAALNDIMFVQAAIDEALREATQADEKAANELRNVQNSINVADPTKAIQIDQVAAAHVQMDIFAGDIPRQRSSSLVSSWWESLTRQQQEWLTLAEPTMIAGLDGIPQQVKDVLHGGDKFDRVKLVQYALDHWNDSGIDKFGNNCANFVSMALKASGVQQKSDGWGPFGENNWFEGQQTGLSILDSLDFTHSASWTRASNLHDFLIHNGSQEISLDRAKPGDVIFFEQDSANRAVQQGQIHHTAIVTAVTPDGDIKYTQHTDNFQNLSLTGRELHESTVEGQQKVIVVRISPNWY